ncbi:jhy protein homolog [Cyrtonyx montezumae]|uniref:jhy protein homolog n=1 Tax=Cyrtonyx montezumae TaxID=9017 RepID=UPI0032DAFD14
MSSSRISVSDMEYTAVSSPYTFHMSNKCIPQGELTQPRIYSASWKRLPGSKGIVYSELHDSQDSDTESLVLEKHSQLQEWTCVDEELVGLKAEEMENDSLEEEDSLEKWSSEEQEEAKHGTVQYIVQKESNSREQQPVDKYFSLKYNPNWRNTKEALQFTEVGKTHHAAEEGSVSLSQDSFHLHSVVFSEEKDQQEVKFQETFSEFGTKLLSFHEPNAFVCSKPFRLHTRGNESQDGYYFKDSPSTCSSAFSLQIREDQPQRAKINFVEKNRRTLGLRTDKDISYLELHDKKEEVCQERVAGTKTVEGEPVQSALPDPNTKMDPEVRWYLNSQQLKNCQWKSAQRKTVKSDQNPKGRAFPRSDNRQPEGRPAKPKSCHYRHCQMSECQTAPMHTEKQDNSSALQEWLCPLGPDTDTAANSDTCLNNFPNCTRKKSKNSQRDCPNDLQCGQQHLDNHATVPFFPRNDSTSGQAHPNQSNISSTFNANCHKTVKDPMSLQACERHICASNSLWLSQSSVDSSSADCCIASQQTLTMEQQHQEMSCLREAGDNQQLVSPLLPLMPQVESDSVVDPKKGERNYVKINQSNSEGYVMQMEKQKKHKVYKKPCSSKICINIDVKLGGLGPDYEAIKQKKERLKQQKEYSQQVKEHNMKNITLIQRLPTKPQPASSVSRQKALEYAKKIPKPKVFTARHSNEEVKNGGVLLPAFKRNFLPPITLLEALQSRHEKEKQVVEAFKTLPIF